ncbi:MAG: hypothetical protein KF754_05300 [Planctomycetes bacterium]|nr:hypothetical protein [Planctomycetota bacterium]
MKHLSVLHRRLVSPSAYDVELSNGSAKVRAVADVREELPTFEPMLPGEYGLADGTYLYTVVEKEVIDRRLRQFYERPEDSLTNLRHLYAEAGLNEEHIRIGFVRERVGAGALGALFLKTLCLRLDRPQVEQNIFVEWVRGVGLQIVAINYDTEDPTHIVIRCAAGDPARYSEAEIARLRAFIGEHIQDVPRTPWSREDDGNYRVLVGGLTLDRPEIRAIGQKGFKQWVVMLEDLDLQTSRLLTKCLEWMRMEDADSSVIRVRNIGEMPSLYVRLDHRLYPCQVCSVGPNGTALLEVAPMSIDEIPDVSIYEGNEYSIVLTERLSSNGGNSGEQSGL